MNSDLKIIRTFGDGQDELTVSNVSTQSVLDVIGLFLQTGNRPIVETEQVQMYDPVVVHRNGLPMYRAEISCSVCGEESEREVMKSNTYVRCGQCQQKLKMEPMFDEYLRANKRGICFKASKPFIDKNDVVKSEGENE